MQHLSIIVIALLVALIAWPSVERPVLRAIKRATRRFRPSRGVRHVRRAYVDDR